MSPDATTSDQTDEPSTEQAQDDARGADGAGATDVEALKRERDDLFDRLARVSAEFQNFQKRVQRDRAKWTQDAVRDVLSGLLSVPDTIDLALGAIDRGSDPQSVKQGVELVRDELRRQLGNQGVLAMDISKGSPFDPEKHQAVAVEEVPGLAREEVSFVARPGYTIGDTVLRPAQVGVRKPAPSQ
jgi:molecular chaperone GrpE